MSRAAQDGQARLERFLDAERRRVDAALDRLLPPVRSAPTRLHTAMRYAVLGGGKRLRPVLSILAFRSAGGSGSRIVLPACALEVVHAFSLIHDDLPCLDDDDLRRGRASVHRAFDEATALLAGDALLTLAFEWVARIGEPGVQADVLAALARATGSRGMIGGQALETELTAPDAEAIRRVHALKTGALFEAATAIGGAAAGAGSRHRATLQRYGRALGLAFQIADDLLDADDADGSSVFRVLGGAASRQALERAGRAARRAATELPTEERWRRLLIGLVDFVEERGRAAAAVAVG